MEKTFIRQLINDFESHKHEQDGVEFWYARDLYRLLGYEKWEMFPKVIKRAEAACMTSGFEVENHFEPFSRRVEIGSGAKRPVKDFRLTTNWNIQQKELFGEYPITQEHVKSNETIRRALKELGIVPEDLPRAEDVKKVERRLKSEKKKTLKSAKGLKKGK